MTWSCQKPTSPGYFWRRDRKHGWAEEVVEVESRKKMGILNRPELHADDEPISSCSATMEWAGPISKPQEVEK